MTNIINIDDRRPGPTTQEEENVPLDTQSWAPEVIADSTGKWLRNSLRFATQDEAIRSANDLMYRWTAVRECRAALSGDPVNYRLTDDGKLEPVK